MSWMRLAATWGKSRHVEHTLLQENEARGVFPCRAELDSLDRIGVGVPVVWFCACGRNDLGSSPL
jgi:hypothetical protein